MLRVGVLIQNISAERFWDIYKPLPPVNISSNLNLISIDKGQDDTLEVPFVFAISYNPAIAQINIKGKAHVTGSKEELKEIQETYAAKKPPPPVIVQTISNVAFIESVILSRTLGIPPPIPLPQIPPPGKEKPEPSYRA
jgi:hypothetical protein